MKLNRFLYEIKSFPFFLIDFYKLFLNFFHLLFRFNTVFLSNLSPYRTEPSFFKNTSTFKIDVFCPPLHATSHLSSHFSSLLNTVTRTVTLNVTFLRIIRWRKIYRCTYRYRYYHYKNNALRARLKIWSRVTVIVTVFYKRHRHRYKLCDALLLPSL